MMNHRTLIDLRNINMVLGRLLFGTCLTVITLILGFS